MWVLKNYIDKYLSKLLKKNDVKVDLLGEDVCEGLVVVILVKVLDFKFLF